MHGPGRPSRCAGRLSLVWRPRLDPGSQLGGANCASPGRQRTHMRVRNSQSGTANGPCRDLQNTQHDAIATPTGNLRSRHRRLPLYRHKREAVTSFPIPSSHTLAATAEPGARPGGGLARRRHHVGEDAVVARLGLRAAKHVGQTADPSVRTVAVAPDHICFGEGTFAIASVGCCTRTFHLGGSGDTASETARSATGHRSVPPLIRRGWRLCGC
jgi:hypothetical protein